MLLQCALCTLLRHPLRSDGFAPLLLPLLPVKSKLSHRRRCLSFKAKIVHQIECACCTHRTSVRTILMSVRMNVRIFLSSRVMRFFSHPIIFYGGRRCEEDARCAHVCVHSQIKRAKAGNRQKGEQKSRRWVHLKKSERPIKAFPDSRSREHAQLPATASNWLAQHMRKK